MYSQGMPNGRRGRLDERYIRRLLEKEETPPPGRSAACGVSQSTARQESAGGCGCGCGTGQTPETDTQYGCGQGGRYAITDRPLAMAYVPVQAWEERYSEQEGLQRGTLFKQLDLPFGGVQIGDAGQRRGGRCV